jgi:uncharacterized protein YjiS (DUF1127 family)
VAEAEEAPEQRQPQVSQLVEAGEVVERSQPIRNFWPHHWVQRKQSRLELVELEVRESLQAARSLARVALGVTPPLDH